MKKFSTFLFTIMLSLAAAAGNPYYTTTVGAKATYVNKDANGKITGYAVETIKSVSTAKGLVIESYFDFMDPARKSVISSPMEMSATLVDLKTTHVTIGNVKAALKSDAYISRGNILAVPADAKVGDVLPDHTINIKASVVKTNNILKSRKITGAEKITVPAGEFECLILEEKEYSQGGKEPYTVKSWIARGIGVIRQDAWKPDGSFQKRMELVEAK